MWVQPGLDSLPRLKESIKLPLLPEVKTQSIVVLLAYTYILEENVIRDLTSKVSN